ncbi:MAG: MFS transporter [Gammaproteobacteria bacterium]
MATDTAISEQSEIESPYAWVRLFTSLALMTLGSSGMYIVVVAMPAIEADFGSARAGASLPFTLIMLGWGFGGIWMGRLSDRYSITVPITIGSIAIGAGFIAAAQADSLLMFALANGIFIGFLGCSTMFAPLLADITYWFSKRRGIAVAICASGNYIAGAVWPPITNYYINEIGWRETYFWVGILCLLVMFPMTLLLRRKRTGNTNAASSNVEYIEPKTLGLTPNALLVLIFIAGVGCCVAMAMPQVHIVSMCHDFGYGPARGAEMLSLMLGFGIVSRLGFGMVTDKLGGLRTLLIASSLQCIALFLFLPAGGLQTLYVVSIMFGLFQGGIVPCYAIIVREYFPANEAGAKLGIIILATLIGMALGGYLSGVIFDFTGSYDAAFIHGIAWNLVNVAIAAFLLHRRNRHLTMNGQPGLA